ncbi:hypothetical protein [Streptacidiphilus sp. P02-A3a]|uniref:hypothetical protein n=1 Tax=Streptacidiphilus sp. P02-A3a TaxID=2704468 RepID=UPI00272B58CE|nr:hypothetical protein [Streptacidiphilus sp. P02-A3a]
MVEHDLRTIAVADWIIGLGPGAGTAGGRVVAEGVPHDVARSGDTPTATHLRGYLAARTR